MLREFIFFLVESRRKIFIVFYLHMLYMYSKHVAGGNQGGVNMLALRLPPDIEKRLDALAKKTGRTKSFYAREAILRHLDDLEDIYLAEKILDRIKTGKEHTYTIDEVERELGLAD